MLKYILNLNVLKMDLDEILNRRFSCRAYKNKDVDDKRVLKILKNAMLSPNSGNIQAWRFIVVKNEGKREEIAIACLKQKWMTQAPVHIVILNDSKYSKAHYDKRGEIYGIQDCTLAASNMMLTASYLNLDTCFVSAFDEDMLKRALEIPKEVTPYVVITLGYGNEKQEGRKRYSYNINTFFEKYGNKEQGKGIFPLSKFKKDISNLKSKLVKHIK